MGTTRIMVEDDVTWTWEGCAIARNMGRTKYIYIFNNLVTCKHEDKGGTIRV
jgi:hypothetical protein